MSTKLFSGENLPYIIIGAVTLILVIFGVVLISRPAPKPLTDGQKSDLLVKEDSVFTGPEDADVVLVNFSDFQCPHCADYVPIEAQLREEFGDQVKFVYRYYSINLSNPAAFPNGLVAAEAAEAANTQGKFWEMHDLLFANQDEWSNLSKTQAQKKFGEYAKEAGVENLEKFTKDLETSKTRDKLVQDFEDGEAIGVSGTPTIFLNGEKVSDWSYEALSAEIKTLLEE